MITRTATKRINWASYKMSQATDKVGVYVSIVSTKIPYKGAGKEYIGMPLKQHSHGRTLQCMQGAHTQARTPSADG